MMLILFCNYFENQCTVLEGRKLAWNCSTRQFGNSCGSHCYQNERSYLRSTNSSNIVHGIEKAYQTLEQQLCHLIYPSHPQQTIQHHHFRQLMPFADVLTNRKEWSRKTITWFPSGAFTKHLYSFCFLFFIRKETAIIDKNLAAFEHKNQNHIDEKTLSLAI